MPKVFLGPEALWDRAMKSSAPDRRSRPGSADLIHKERAAYRSAISGCSKRADKRLRRFSWEDGQ